MKHAPLLVLGWAAALLLAFHPMLLSGLALVPGDLGDARLVNYLLEHTWRWLLREPLHRDLFSPPIFYPTPNAAAYSDLLVSAAPFYWCWRAAGLPADTAFQLWLLTVGSLNYLAMYAFLVRVLRLGSLAAALGAVLFAAGSPRVAEVVHAQFYAHFYTVVAAYALARFVEADAAARGRSAALWLGLFCIASVLQIYASFYLGWFLGLALLVAAAAACARAATRRALFAVLGRRRGAVLGWAAGAAALAAPLAWHYLAAARDAGVRDWGTVAAGLPAPQAWLLLYPTSWLYAPLPLLHATLGAPGLEPLGVGLATTAAAGWGLWGRRKSPAFYLLFTTAAALALLVTAVGPFSLWVAIYFTVPGGAAVRAAYRVCLVALLAMAAGAAACVQDRKRAGAAAGLALACVLEQAQTPPTFPKDDSRSRIDRAAARVPADCATFLYTPRAGAEADSPPSFVQLDAMWAGLKAGKPTLNGYSGLIPPCYPFAVPVLRGPGDEENKAYWLKDWCERGRLDPATVAWVRD